MYPNFLIHVVLGQRCHFRIGYKPFYGLYNFPLSEQGPILSEKRFIIVERQEKNAYPKDEKKAKSSQKKSEEKNHLLQKQSLNQVKRILQKERQVLELRNQRHWNWKTLLFFVCHRLARTRNFLYSVEGKTCICL